MLTSGWTPSWIWRANRSMALTGGRGGPQSHGSHPAAPAWRPQQVQRRSYSGPECAAHRHFPTPSSVSSERHRPQCADAV